MKTLRTKWPFLVCMIFLLLITYSIYRMSRRQFFMANANCIKPFHEFAFLPDETPRPISEILPGSPWQVEATIPGIENVATAQIELARTINGKEEIWLFNDPFIAANAEESFVIYYPQSQTWEDVSAFIGDTNLVVRALFVTSDGTIWGTVNAYQPHSVLNIEAVLGRFNESTRRFDLADGLAIPMTLDNKFLSQPLEIVLDKQDNFWIFGPDDGIYRYDPYIQATERQTDLPDTETYSVDAILAANGSFYFRYSSASYAEEFLFQFIPETGEVIALDVPREPWETSRGMLVDHRGRLWLGAMGYMETDGSLYLLHPDAPMVWENRSEFLYWSPPTLLLESSNGLLWYSEYHDMSLLGEGTAWYDPETGEGCLFTNVASNVVEDEDKQLWMVADGKLYRYPLRGVEQ